MGKQSKEEQYRLKCETIVNEDWAKASLHVEEIKKILLKDTPENSRELSLLKIASTAFVEKVMLLEAEDLTLFGVDVSA